MKAKSISFYLMLSLTILSMTFGLYSIYLSLEEGVGLWGNNNTIAWGIPIVNFVFWIGVGHAGTLISAILFIFRQQWRTAIARFAEAMTIFAVITASLFPILHTGRPWLSLVYLFPYPNQNGIWVNFNSPLVWDLFAILTYLTVSLAFWYLGLIPDFAILRDRTQNPFKKKLYHFLSFGWTYDSSSWIHYEKLYALMAGLATPLVVSVHTIVSFDFAASIIPGWHSTIFGPYFVVGAIFSGFGMVLAVLTILRKAMKLEDLITVDHLEKMAKLILAMSILLAYSYLMELFMAIYSGHEQEIYVFSNRAFGKLKLFFWGMIFFNVVLPQVFWMPSFRQNPWILLTVGVFVGVGMWLERYVIVISSLSRDFLPANWYDFQVTLIDIGLTVGSFGLFFFLVLIFTRTLPVISLSEIQAEKREGESHG